MKKTGVVLDLIELLPGRNLRYLEKNGVLKFFERLHRPGPVVLGLSNALLKISILLHELGIVQLQKLVIVVQLLNMLSFPL